MKRQSTSSGFHTVADDNLIHCCCGDGGSGGSGSGSGAGGDEVFVVCCDVPVKRNLTATITASTCANLVGVSIPILYEGGSVWIGETIVCSRTFRVRLECPSELAWVVTGSWGGGAEQICISGYGASQVSANCDPLQLVFETTDFIEFPCPCCGNTSVDFTMAVTE